MTELVGSRPSAHIAPRSTVCCWRFEDLHVEFRTDEGTARAINGIDLDLSEGETLAILGESGSGKSVTAQAIMGILDMPPARIPKGSIKYRGEDLLQMPENAASGGARCPRSR